MSLYDSSHWGAFRFSLVNVPAHATVLGAHLHAYLDSNAEDIAVTVVYLEDADSAAGFAATTNNISSRARAPGGVAWNQDYNIQSGTGGWVDSVELVSLVQSFVDRAGYVPGAYVGLILNGNQDALHLLEIRQHNYNVGEYAASLVVRIRVP